MDTLERMTPQVAKIFAAKEERRQALARLAFPEKVQAVMQLQQMAAVILRARGKRVRPWDLSFPSAPAPRVSSPAI